MRRIVLLLTAVVAIFAVIMLTSCKGSGDGDKPDSSVESSQTGRPVRPSQDGHRLDEGNTPPVRPTETADAPPSQFEPPFDLPFDLTGDELRGLWERIDGSTATIPLTTALHEYFNAAGAPPTHYTTPYAYNNLFWGGADLVFVTYPSEAEFANAQSQNVEIEIIPIVKDALVFLVNTENPIDKVSQEQLRNIYTGRITNWKALGGLDESVVPYQRTLNSGSQTLFLKLLMDGAVPMQPPIEWEIESMGALVEVVSAYSNARDAVGYSMFYYVNNMYGNDRFKLLAVDGVKPSRDTIARGDYPLEEYYYAVMRKDTPADSPARKLISWLLTEAGQTVAVKAGYIPLQPLTGVLPDETIDPVFLGDVDNSKGTGGTVLKPDAADEIVVNGVRKPLSDLFYDGFNYISYINGEIISYLNSPQSAYHFGDDIDGTRLSDNMKRPFTGIPNNYPNYEIWDGYDGNRYIFVNITKDNPFFDGPKRFDIRLTSDISPYGIGIDDFSVVYDYDRRVLPDVDLYTLSVKLPQSPEVAERINSQLKEWTDTFAISDENAKVLDSFVKWVVYNWGSWGDGSGDYAYRLQPNYGIWGDWLSVFYQLQTYDGPAGNMPVILNISFDIKTGEIIDPISVLPRDILSEEHTFYGTIDLFEAGEWPSYDRYEDYIPARGSVINSEWFDGYSIGLYLTEPGGRKLRVNIYEWD